jgi:3-dehydroquinate dehydratase-2
VAAATHYGLTADCRQSNSESELIGYIHEAREERVVGIVINGGAYSHTSIALHDAIAGVRIPTVEVHVSNVYTRESFRHHSFIAKAAFASLCGFGIEGYRLAISGLAAKIGANAVA